MHSIQIFLLFILVFFYPTGCHFFEETNKQNERRNKIWHFYRKSLPVATKALPFLLLLFREIVKRKEKAYSTATHQLMHCMFVQTLQYIYQPCSLSFITVCDVFFSQKILTKMLMSFTVIWVKKIKSETIHEKKNMKRFDMITKEKKWN